MSHRSTLAASATSLMRLFDDSFTSYVFIVGMEEEVYNLLLLMRSSPVFVFAGPIVGSERIEVTMK